MTISKEKEIRIPVPLLSVILSVLFSAFVLWQGISESKAELTRAKKDIEVLRQEKVDKEVMNLVLDKLDKIDKKFDTHIARP